MENNTNSEGIINNITQEQEVIKKYPTSIKTMLILYVIWFIVSVALSSFMLTPFDGLEKGWVGFGLLFVMPVIMGIGFILGITGFIFTVRSKDVMSSQQRVVSLFFSVLLFTVLVPAFCIPILGKALTPLTYKLFNKSYVANSNRLEEKNKVSYINDQESEYRDISEYFNQPRKVTRVFEGAVVIEDLYLVRLDGLTANQFHDLQQNKKDEINLYLEEHYKNKLVTVVLPPLGNVSSLGYVDSPVSGGESASFGSRKDAVTVKKEIYRATLKGEVIPFFSKTSEPSLKLTYPAGGESYKIGDSINVTWSSSNFSATDTLKITLSKIDISTSLGAGKIVATSSVLLGSKKIILEKEILEEMVKYTKPIPGNNYAISVESDSLHARGYSYEKATAFDKIFTIISQ